ncbi:MULTISPECIES: winged helix-turn-helix domain-containing protein [Enterococcus]|uniref:winged helix-turn-helix domain-containing protein n=1 Tax=Enterococcus TaxID=1350 RepID=UPI001E5375CF|nr:MULTISPECIES: winged helix-turn-helix domain-containing protein [Enterococcus]
MRHRGQSFSKEDIYVAVYGYDAQGDSQTTITERVKKIRAKFARTNQNPIQTIWDVGYKWQSKDHYGD